MIPLILTATKAAHGLRASPGYRASRARMGAALIATAWLFSGAGCATTPPANVENICAIFDEKSSWYRAAKKSEKRWGTPVHVQLSIIRQESSFRFDARPPRTKLLGFIPWTRPSDAYGYAQALAITDIVPQNDFFDYESKYTKGKTEYLAPAPLDPPQAERARDLALEAFRLCGCRDFARVDLMLDEQDAFWILEINTLPGLKETSLLPMSAAAEGIGFEELLARLLQPARARFEKRYSTC